MVCGVTISSLEITLILQPARSDVKIGPVRTQVRQVPTVLDLWLRCIR